MLAGGLYERTSGAAGQPLGGYRRRVPERTVLHELVAGYAQTLIAELREADPEGGGLPRYVERELAAYLRCGILAHGFTRVRCQAAMTRSSSRSRVSDGASVRHARHGEWRTLQRTSWIACCRARPIVSGCSRFPSCYGFASRAMPHELGRQPRRSLDQRVAEAHRAQTRDPRAADRGRDLHTAVRFAPECEANRSTLRAHCYR